jgi:hypothetical protein
MEKKCYKTAQIELFKKLFGIISNESKKFIEEKLKKAAELVKKEEKKDQ